jgi:hypothetical protein
MTATEMDGLAAQFDEEFVPTTPLTPQMRARHLRAKAKRGRPKIGKGAKDVMISVERDLLKAVDRYAKAHGMSRSELFARGVRGLLKAG